MKKLIGLLLLLICAFSTFAVGERLIGTWKSNKDGTIAYLKAHTQLTAEQLDRVSQSLGKVSLIFDQTNLTLMSGDWKFVSPYKVVSETKNSITIESKDPSTQQMSPTVFEFEAGSLWSPDDRIPGYKERFDKQK
jgi:hypothetical protein